MCSLCESFITFKDVDKILIGRCSFHVSDIKKLSHLDALLKTPFNIYRQLGSMIVPLFA